MKVVAYRFATTASAIVLGVLLVLFLTLLGKRSSGPVQDLFDGLGSGVSEIESRYILSVREESRPRQLQWFEPYRKDIKKLVSPDRIFLGGYDDKSSETFQSIVELEQSIKTTLPFIQIYCAWGSKPGEEFPLQQARTIAALGSVPFITWEPWLTDFEGEEFVGLPAADKRDKNGLKLITAGVFDPYIDKWAAKVKEIEIPVFVRMGHEMNDPYRYPWGPQNNKAEDFIKAWKHTVDRFRRAGVKNVIWVWSPHPAYKWFDAYYPGADYVDWVGVGTLNYGTTATWSKWWSFKEIFGNYYADLAKFGKPIAVTEFASLGVGGDRAQWYWDALNDMPKQYPAVKSVIFFHAQNDNTTTYKALNWYIKDDTVVTGRIVKAVKGWK